MYVQSCTFIRYMYMHRQGFIKGLKSKKNSKNPRYAGSVPHSIVAGTAPLAIVQQLQPVAQILRTRLLLHGYIKRECKTCAALS